MSVTIDYYLSLISPFTYLGHARLLKLAAKHGATVVHKPMKLPEVFAETGGVPLPKRSPQRRAYRLAELARWREHLGVPLVLEPKHFPADESLAARVVIAAQEAGQSCGELALGFLRAVWAEERDIADRDTVRTVIAAAGLDPEPLLVAAEGPRAAETWDRNTREAIERGVFGAPTYALGTELFWGQDRLDFLDRALVAAARG